MCDERRTRAARARPEDHQAYGHRRRQSKHDSHRPGQHRQQQQLADQPGDHRARLLEQPREVGGHERDADREHDEAERKGQQRADDGRAHSSIPAASSNPNAAWASAVWPSTGLSAAPLARLILQTRLISHGAHTQASHAAGCGGLRSASHGRQRERQQHQHGVQAPRPRGPDHGGKRSPARCRVGSEVAVVVEQQHGGRHRSDGQSSRHDQPATTGQPAGSDCRPRRRGRKTSARTVRRTGHATRAATRPSKPSRRRSRTGRGRGSPGRPARPAQRQSPSRGRIRLSLHGAPRSAWPNRPP